MGYIGDEGLEGIAIELQRTGKDAMVTGERGKFMTLADASTALPKPKAPPAPEPTEAELDALDAPPEDDGMPF